MVSANINLDIEEDEHARLSVLPKSSNDLRACLFCSLIKTVDQFDLDGCDNCDEFLEMQNSRDRVYECTSANFQGMIALMQPRDSWVARWQRINRHVPGIYAISVGGALPDHVSEELEDRGISYHSRDRSIRSTNNHSDPK